MTRCAVLCLPLLLVSACSSLSSREPPTRPPALIDMEESLEHQQEPQDEEARRALPAGSFSGVYVDDAKKTLDDFGATPVGIPVSRVVENSPAALAGIEEGDLLLEAGVGSGATKPLEWSSEWRQIELEASPGEVVHVLFDRAGSERRADIVVVPRAKPATRGDTERYREESKLGVVVRTATEVESRAANLGPGAGAVVIGMSARSPLRAAGIVYGDLLVAVNDAPLAHPNVLLDVVRQTPTDGVVRLQWRHGEEVGQATVPLTSREGEFTDFNIPVLVDYESRGDEEEFSLLLGLFGWETTAAAWRVRFLWFLTFGGGDADRLEEVKP